MATLLLLLELLMTSTIAMHLVKGKKECPPFFEFVCVYVGYFFTCVQLCIIVH